MVGCKCRSNWKSLRTPRTLSNGGYTMTRYKLLKDLPGYKAGTVFKQDPYWSYEYEDGTWVSCTDLAGVLNRAPNGSIPDWFAPIEAEQKKELSIRAIYNV